MSDRERTNQDVLDRQERMLRLAERDHGLSSKVLSAETGIPVVTIASWRRDNIAIRARMSLADFVVLAKVIPAGLLSLAFESADKCVCDCEPSDGDAHSLARDSGDYNVAYLGATDPSSEAGPIISPRERAQLNDIHRRMKGRKVA